MSVSERWRERALIDAMRPRLEAEGFVVLIEPTRDFLPPFLQNFRPDAIAVRPGEGILIEIARPSSGAEGRLEKLRSALDGQPDWRLDVVYAPSVMIEAKISPASPDDIERQIDRLTGAAALIGPAATLVAAWSVLEAAARLAVGSDLERPQSPAALLDLLAGEGYVTPDEADFLRDLGRRRNEAAHGGLDVVLAGWELEELAAVIRRILSPAD